MIKILDSTFKRQATLKNAINPTRFEEINGENTLDFSAILDDKVSTYINENAVIELDGDYFDIAYLEKADNADGTLTVSVETEHISYRLNDPKYNKEWFTEIGTPDYILGKILEGTEFTLGIVEFTDVIAYSAQEKKSRRQLLMELVHLLDGEVDFNKFEISIVKHRGSTELKPLAKGKNIKVVSKIYNKREVDKEGNPLVAYTCEPIQLTNKPIGLGDDVLLIQKDLGIKEQLRIVSYSYNPYDNIEASIELANFISGLEDDIYRIETTTVAKEKVYNGCRIGPDEGFVAERSDFKAKTIMNATEGISIYSDIGEGLERNFFVDLDGRIKGKALDIAGDATFQGAISASTIDIGNGTFTVDIYGNMLAKSGQFKGTISTEEDAEVGNNIYLGNMESNNSKGIYFSTGVYESDITLDASGKLSIFNWTDMLIFSSADIGIDAFELLDLGGTNVDISCATTGEISLYGTTFLDWETYLGNAANENLVATMGDIDIAIQQHISAYHSAPLGG